MNHSPNNLGQRETLVRLRGQKCPNGRWFQTPSASNGRCYLLTSGLTNSSQARSSSVICADQQLRLRTLGREPLLHILCASRSTIYTGQPGLDIYTKTKSAWLCQPRRPIIAHPPCRFWSRWNARASAATEDLIEELLLGMHCANLVKEFGGILEQPAHSRLWQAANLPLPNTTGEDDAWSIEVDQSNFGHLCNKPTWLFFANCRRRKMTWSGWHLANPRRPTLAALTPGQRSATPTRFRDFLITNALLARPRTHPQQPASMPAWGYLLDNASTTRSQLSPRIPSPRGALPR